MLRRLSESKEREYTGLRRFFEVWEARIAPSRFFALEHPHHPLNVLKAVEDASGRSVALVGLRQAIDDILEGGEDYSPENLARIDEVLRSEGAPTLSFLLSRQKTILNAVLRRGRIRDHTEFYIVSAALSDTSACRSSEQTEMLGTMIMAYESKA